MATICSILKLRQNCIYINEQIEPHFRNNLVQTKSLYQFLFKELKIKNGRHYFIFEVTSEP